MQLHGAEGISRECFCVSLPPHRLHRIFARERESPELTSISCPRKRGHAARGHVGRCAHVALRRRSRRDAHCEPRKDGVEARRRGAREARKDAQDAGGSVEVARSQESPLVVPLPLSLSLCVVVQARSVGLYRLCTAPLPFFVCLFLLLDVRKSKAKQYLFPFP